MKFRAKRVHSAGSRGSFTGSFIGVVHARGHNVHPGQSAFTRGVHAREGRSTLIGTRSRRKLVFAVQLVVDVLDVWYVVHS